MVTHKIACSTNTWQACSMCSKSFKTSHIKAYNSHTNTHLQICTPCVEDMQKLLQNYKEG